MLKFVYYRRFPLCITCVLYVYYGQLLTRFYNAFNSEQSLILLYFLEFSSLSSLLDGNCRCLICWLFLIICVLPARYQTTFTTIFYNCYYYTPYLLLSQYARFKLSSNSTLRTAIYSTIESPCALNPLSPVL